jgi:ankyrin repeat protein
VVLARVQKQGAAGLQQALREGTAVWRLHARDGQTLLHHAAAHGLLDVVQLIVKKAPRGEFTPRKDEGGRTALHVAAAAGHVAVVEELIRRARLSLLDADSREGMSPLHLIARMGWNTVTMPRLLALVHKRASGKVDPRNKALETPLHQACLRGEPEMVRWLLDVGASIDAQKDTGETPLHLAARRGSLALIRLLLDRGANPQLAAADGRVPRDVADGLCSEALARATGESEQARAESGGARSGGDESPRSASTTAGADSEAVTEHSLADVAPARPRQERRAPTPTSSRW